MSFADDLLEQAYHLANREEVDPKQASLRRAVLTAYYALFHLLIDESVGNWNVERQRGVLARTFDHGKMKSICDDCVKVFFSSGSPPERLRLKHVAQAFSELQENRHIADYDNTVLWSRMDAIKQLEAPATAFKHWRAIRASDEAQDFLLTLFLPKPPRR